ncbi:MAG: Gx transporter family protein, partial [Clostridia bacterium]|nr:Gx transporter family protein [Clostridia bacterium]
MKNFSVKRLVFTAVLASLALISFTIESLFPPIFVPGARLGVSNLFVLLAIIFLGVKEGVAVFAVKALLGSLFAGNFSAIIYSLPAGIICL